MDANLVGAKSFGEIPVVEKKQKKQKGRIKDAIGLLSRGLMLPIAMLPIAGLFLGIGAAIVTNSSAQWAIILGNAIKLPGNVVFGCLPVLFAIAIAITFTKDSGTAGLSAFVGWIVFCAIQSAFIITNKDHSVQFLWYHLDEIKYSAIFTSNVGIQSLSTSVFGGITIGFVVAFLYNKFKDIKLPTVIGFFSGVRFIPIVTFGASLVLGLFFSIVWPEIGIGLYEFGNALAKAPLGINALVFGIAERSLVPFGLHHAFYSPLWYTAAGGSFNINAEIIYRSSTGLVHTGITWAAALPKLADAGATTFNGDQTLWMFINTYIAGQHLINVIPGHPDFLVTFANLGDFTAAGGGAESAAKAGEYMQGKYSFMMFGLPAAAAAMIFAVPKETGNRKQAMSIIGSAAITSFLTGITEPLEFTFLFLAPWLFWGLHAILAGVSFWLMSILGAHMGMTFSGGAIDFVVYGILPDATHKAVHCYWALLIGAAFIPLYFFTFYYLIKQFNVKTPGRDSELKLFTKKDYQAKVSSKDEPKTVVAAQKGDDFELANKVIAAYGGKENIVNVDACITKLRIKVVDPSKVNRDELMKLGARGVIKPSPNSVYAIFGFEADFIKNKINILLFGK